ncbi:MAG TPA: L-threonylcarbamoyladenylate synthase [Candidatus Saccharimonadales bacterium]|nr:L-threonylcarbamoyladenylate synthase [Candidatus Saccharimonadales bacterium]
MRAEDTDECIKILQTGGVTVMPTDTVYGVVCRAADEHAVERLYRLKSREKKPGTVIAASIEQLTGLGIKRRYLTAVSQFWPGAVSVEIPHDLAYLNQGTGRQALRVVKEEWLADMLAQTGPLLTSSANLPGEPTSADIDEAKGYFSDKVDFYLDGGRLEARKPSTLIRVVDDAIEVLREGTVKINEAGEIVK